jgi:tRNA pseudouridine32 synthase/23S rRNA pseudouridine746 synthase
LEHLISFKAPIAQALIPTQFILSNNAIHPLCLLAAEQVQDYLKTQQDWEHNFGLTPSSKGAVIGKMFGVLVVETADKAIGFLAAFSGKLADSNTFTYFVPPIFDLLAEDSFLHRGMRALTEMTEEIKRLETDDQSPDQGKIRSLKESRKNHSIHLQQQIFDQYQLLNRAGIAKSLVSIFKDAGYKQPPAGAGECAAPKLLQYAYLHALRPLALAEFWWGQSPKSATWKHQNYYMPCKEKCEPILAHMLGN